VGPSGKQEQIAQHLHNEAQVLQDSEQAALRHLLGKRKRSTASGLQYNDSKFVTKRAKAPNPLSCKPKQARERVKRSKGTDPAVSLGGWLSKSCLQTDGRGDDPRAGQEGGESGKLPSHLQAANHSGSSGVVPDDVQGGKVGSGYLDGLGIVLTEDKGLHNTDVSAAKPPQRRRVRKRKQDVVA
jgi:hypothetical protein